MKHYTCIVIEDEPLAQNVLKKYIGDHPSLSLLKVFSDAIEAQSFLSEQSIDVIFLDINLPKLSGINFIKSLVHPPHVIFTTAYSQFAVEGFELNAVDYLLKPFSFERFLKAVNKAIEKVNNHSQTVHKEEDGFVFLKAEKKIHKIDLATIHYLEAIGDYVKVVTASGPLIVNETMKKMQDDLPRSHFIRVHKSFIISRDKIRFIEGNYVQVGNKSIPIGATYRHEVFAHIERKN